MDDDTSTTGRGGGSKLKAALAWLAILGLLAMVAWLASERNARTWYLVPADGRIVVMKGLLLPIGRGAFATSDPALAQAYAPLVPPPGKGLPAERAFEERGLVDQARAEKLPGLSPTQREDLDGLRAESGYQEAMRLLARAMDDLREASDRLRRAAGSRSAHAADARRLLKELEPAVDAASTALRQAAPKPRPAAETAPEGAKAGGGDSGR